MFSAPHTQSIITRRGRRLAIAAALAAGIASGSAAIVTTDHPGDAAAQASSISTRAQALHVGATSASFVRRFRQLESAGYVEVACRIDGAMMFNPSTHRYVTVRA
jgi:hypothetical protein